MNLSKVFSENKIKTALSSQFVGIFKENFKVIPNILFLMLQQMPPEGGFANDLNGKKGSSTYKSLKTMELREVRKEEIRALDDEPQYLLSKHQLNQFNMMKKILVNFAFRNKGKLILSTDIINDTMDEMRCERKIMMVLEDRNVN